VSLARILLLDAPAMATTTLHRDPQPGSQSRRHGFGFFAMPKGPLDVGNRWLAPTSASGHRRGWRHARLPAAELYRGHAPGFRRRACDRLAVLAIVLINRRGPRSPRASGAEPPAGRHVVHADLGTGLPHVRADAPSSLI
jgi:hypothetical protein